MDYIVDPEAREIEYLRAFAPLRDASILEIGCGDGRMTARYNAYPGAITGIDLDENMVRQARQKRLAKEIENGAFLLASAEHMPFLNGHFDGAIFAWSY